MKSIVDAEGMVISNEKLIVRGEFFSLSKEEVDEMARDFYGFYYPIFKDTCVIRQTFCDKSLHDLEECLTHGCNTDGSYSFYAEMYLKTDKMKLVKNLRDYEARRRYSPIHSVGLDESVDYPAYYNRCIKPYLEDKERLKTEIFHLMNKENCVHFGEVIYYDFHARFLCHCMRAGTNLFYGDFFLKVRTYCIEEDIDNWSIMFDAFAKQMMRKHHNLNMYISKNVMDGDLPDYSNYYMDTVHTDFYRKCKEQGIEPGYYHFACNAMEKFYVTEVAGIQYISKATRSLVPLCDSENLNGHVLIEELEGGGLLVRSDKPISRVDVQELKAIKKYIYPLLLPAGIEVSSKLGPIVNDFDRRIRNRWEKVPVFENEILMLDMGYAFVHGALDFDRAFDCMGLHSPFKQ